MSDLCYNFCLRIKCYNFVFSAQHRLPVMAQDIILFYFVLLLTFSAFTCCMSDGINRNEFFHESEEYILI